MKSKKINVLINKPVVETTTIQDIENKLDVSDTPEQILGFIKEYIRDVFNVQGNNKEIRFVLDSLILQCHDDSIKNKLYKMRVLTWD